MKENKEIKAVVIEDDMAFDILISSLKNGCMIRPDGTVDIELTNELMGLAADLIQSMMDFDISAIIGVGDDVHH